MRKLLSVPLLLICIVTYITMAHEQVVHRYVVREAYRLLRTQLGFDVPRMVNHVGNDETGSSAFNPGGLLVIGAHREDEEDIVWHYGIHTTATYTHFWEPDNGDGSHFCAQPTNACYENAYEKARKYLYGGWELQVYYPGVVITEAYEAPDFLPDYYKTGRIFYKGYYESNGSFVSRNYWTTSSQQFRDRVVWEILGRVAHLLTDVGVPTHAHNDQHDPFFGGTDLFEDWMDDHYTDCWNEPPYLEPTCYDAINALRQEWSGRLFLCRVGAMNIWVKM